jgi:hypothetical protein
MPVSKHIVARLSIVSADGTSFYEIYDNSSFYRFYKFYFAKRGTRKRREGEFHRNRNEAKSLEELRDRLIKRWKGAPVLSSKITIYRKKLYKKFLTCPPDELPGGLTRVFPLRHTESEWKVSIPIYGHTTLQKRMDLLIKI